MSIHPLEKHRSRPQNPRSRHTNVKRQGGRPVHVVLHHLVIFPKPVSEIHREGEKQQKNPLLGQHADKAQQGKQAQASV